VPSEDVAHYLALQEGLKASPDLMCQWLSNQPPYKKEHDFIVIKPLRMEQYKHLKTIITSLLSGPSREITYFGAYLFPFKFKLGDYEFLSSI
jgi:hypothetical protein